MANLLDSVHKSLTPHLVAEAAKQLGETEIATSKVLRGWCSAILAGMTSLAGKPKVVDRFHSVLSQFPISVTDNLDALLISGNLARKDPKDLSGHLLGQLFGDKMPALINGVASFSGAKPSSTSFLLGISGPLVLSLLAQRVQSSSLNASGLANLLLGSEEQILSTLPSGLGTIIGLEQMQAHNELPVATGAKWTWALLLLLGLGACILLLIRYS